MDLGDMMVIVTVALLAATTIFLKKLTVPAAVTGWLVAVLLHFGTDATGVWLLAAFFVLGTAATMHRLHKKQADGLAEKRSGQRTAWQVLANAGAAAAFASFAFVVPSQTALLQFVVAASLSAATADTLSSELGNIYGRNYYNILTLKPDQRGANGVVSLQGTFLGMVGSLIICGVYALASGSSNGLAGIFWAGLAGNIVDSILGATLERKGYIGNNAVNFLNTLTGALVGFLWYLV